MDKEAESSIIYVWLGSKADPDELRLIEEIAEEMFNNVCYAGLAFIALITYSFLVHNSLNPFCFFSHGSAFST